MNTKELRKQRGLSQTALGNVLGVTRSTICQYESGKRQPDNDTLIKLADYFGVSTDYLLGRVDTKKITPIKDVMELNDCYPIPLLGRVVAGVPIESQEDLEGYILINREPKDEYFALRVNGESMINAGIRHNSILVIHQQTYAENGDIVVAMLNGEQTVKRFKVYGDSMFLMPENPDFEPIPILKGADFYILGKVVEVRIAF